MKIWNDLEFQKFVKMMVNRYDVREDDVHKMVQAEYLEEKGKMPLDMIIARCQGWMRDPFTEPVKAEHICMYRPQSLYFRLVKHKDES